MASAGHATYTFPCDVSKLATTEWIRVSGRPLLLNSKSPTEPELEVRQVH